MANTTNYNWETPDDTDLVKDGALAIRTLGSAVDTTVFNNAAAAIAKSIVDAKGDIIAATAADTVSRLAVGANNTVLTADSSTATGLKWAAPAAGGMTQLATGSLTGASVVISSISSSYKDLQLIVRNFLPASDDASLRCRVNQDSGAARHTNNAYASASGQEFGATSWSLSAGQDNSVDKSLIVLNVYDYANALTWKWGNTLGLTVNATTTTYYNYLTEIKAYNQTTAVSSLELFCSTGNFTSGTYILYGVS
jgi:hypothetical protein